ncbi:MAG: spermidine/putrescine ABC transporter substrate-binding protein [Solirubrobacteraceae bacterium]|nr:spermidine/putrescine ABC transporter substrate-binding protein [Solirubrobacteraceae bacterium]
MSARSGGNSGHTLPTDALTRRNLLVRAGGGALALSGAASILAACGGGGSSDGGSSATSSGASGGQGKGIGGIPIASKQHPVKLPIYDANQAIKSGLDPEAGPLTVFDWGDYISPEVLKSFEKKYGVKAKLTTYADFQESLGKISSGAIKADVWVPVVERIPQLVAAKLIQPLNHDYIPNFANVIPAMANPYYDQGSQYTMPNYIWTTGILWRGDLLPDLDPQSESNPWDVFWTTQGIKGKLGLQNAEAFDPLSLGLLRNGVTDFPNTTKAQVDEATAKLKELTANGAKFQYTGFQPIANGTQVIAQAWNGDAFVAPGYLKKGTPAGAIRYWFPDDGVGAVNSDFWSIPKSAKNPVLGHLFINHLLEEQTAIENFKVVGYQQPLKGLTAERFKELELGDPDLLDAVVVTEPDADKGLPNPTPSKDQLTWYEDAFASLTSGAS